MTVRLATVSDIPDLLEIGARFHAMSPHKGMGAFDCDGMANVLSFMIDSRSSVVLTNGAGVIGGTLSPVYFNPAKWQCEENFWFADRSGMDLLQGLVEWARANRASFVMLSTLENERSEIIDKVLKRKGFVMLERRYMKEIG